MCYLACVTCNYLLNRSRVETKRQYVLMISFCNVFLTHNSLSYPFDITFMSCHHHISQAKQHCSAKLAAALLSTQTIGSLFSQVSRQIMAKNILTMLASKHPIMSNCLEASSILSRRKEHWHMYIEFLFSLRLFSFFGHIRN